MDFQDDAEREFAAEQKEALTHAQQVALYSALVVAVICAAMWIIDVISSRKPMLAELWLIWPFGGCIAAAYVGFGFWSQMSSLAERRKIRLIRIEMKLDALLKDKEDTSTE